MTIKSIAELGHKILFFGSDSFAHPVLKSLHSYSKSNPEFISDLQVITHFKTSKSKKITNQVEQFALDQKLKIYRPIGQTPDNRKAEWQQFYQSELFQNNSFNLGIVCSYGYMIPSYIIDRFTEGMLVIHPSLLPKYRGASPLQYALLSGDKQTGVSIIEISKLKFDAGRILKQSVFEIPREFTYTDLSNSLAQQSSIDIIDVLAKYREYKQNSTEQKEEEYTKAPKFQNSDTHLNFELEDNEQIYNRYRCFKGTNFASVRTKYNSKEIIIEKMSLPNAKEQEQLKLLINSKPSSIWAFKQKSMKNYVYVKCKEGFIRIDDWRFFDQLSRPAYTFVDQFINREQMSQDLQREGYYYFEKIETENKEQPHE
ncbi:hypothetical protein ABPG72_016407 [Tetrahymena utriculariae]